MALSAKRRLLLAKIESTYGVDSTPAGADAFQVTSLDVSPMDAETVERTLIRPYFGQAEKLMSQINAKASFEIELAGHGGGVVGAMPKLDALLKACGFTGTQQTVSVTGLSQTSNVATGTIGAHSYKVGDKVTISGASPTNYNGTFTLTAVTGTTISYTVTGSPAAATGTILMNSGYQYAPISINIPSVTLYYNVDGVLHKITGAKGNMSVDLQVKSIPKLKFDFVGINNVAADVAAPSADFTAFTIPQVANTQNTSNFSILGYSGALESFNFSLNNQVNYIPLIGKEYVDILDRKASGSMSFEAPTVTAKDFWSAVKAQTTGSLTITHGSANGNKVALSCPRVLLDSPKYKESNSVMMITLGASIMPTTGNDEMTFTFQ